MLNLRSISLSSYQNAFKANNSNSRTNLQGNQIDSFQKSNAISLKSTYSFKNQILSFLGVKVSLLDGGEHSVDLLHFAKALNRNMDIDTVEVEVNPRDHLVKQMGSLIRELNEINCLSRNKQPKYIAMPIVCNVPLLNLSDQMSSYSGKRIRLTPENIKNYKEDIINFFLMISCGRGKYINNMDKIGQGLEDTRRLIQEINRSVQSGIRVFIPTGHPEYDTIKWMAGERGLKPELYNFISTGNDINGVNNRMRSEIQSNGWYDFNLLNLSDATKVNLQDINGRKHFYSAHDSLSGNTGARGVYNFTPIRQGDRLVGFSFTDEVTNQYPLCEFGNDAKVLNLAKFVGLQTNQVLASGSEHKDFLQAIRNGYSIDRFSNKLFRVDEVFSADEIRSKKIKLMGDYVDSSLKLFFRENRYGEIIFPKCDSEGSGRPSVMPMWGSCFSVIKKISDEI